MTAIAIRLEGPALEASELSERYADWLERIDAMHQDAAALANPTPAFATLRRPLHEARVALITSAGAHVVDDEPFDVADPHGDPSFRIIPDGAEVREIAFAHSHYDTTRAEEDPNVVFPLDRLHDLVEDGVVGTAAPRHIGLMGFNPDPRRLAHETVPRLVELLREDDVDVVVLSPG